MLYSLRNQATIRQKVEFAGVGTHSGLPANLAVLPAAINTGFIVERTDIKNKNNIIELKSSNVVDTLMCTKVANSNGVAVTVVEHLLGALRIAGITNALIEIDAEEIPIMDGSGVVFLNEFLKTGVLAQDAKVPAVFLQSEVAVKSNNGVISATPSMRQRIHITLDYERINNVIGMNNSISFNMSNENKLRSIAAARTFGWLADGEKLRAMGLALGASPDNTVIISADDSIINDGGLRNKTELVAHKALDLIGDFALLGYDLHGTLTGINTSHAQNNVFIRTLLSQIDQHAVVRTNQDFNLVAQNKNLLSLETTPSVLC